MLTRSQRIHIRKALYYENPCCFWCFKKMVLHPNLNEIEDMVTIEHLIPRREGGSDDIRNLVLVHKKCNR